MKNVLLKSGILTLMVLSFIILQACNQSGEKQEPSEQHNPAQMEQHEDEPAHEGNVPSMLTLNNGSKWLADNPTNKNAATLISIGEQFSKRSKKNIDRLPGFRERHPICNKQNDQGVHYERRSRSGASFLVSANIGTGQYFKRSNGHNRIEQHSFRNESSAE